MGIALVNPPCLMDEGGSSLPVQRQAQLFSSLSVNEPFRRPQHVVLLVQALWLRNQYQVELFDRAPVERK
jgi:hypothetical protein